MADLAAYQRTTYPLASYNFRVTVGDATMSFTEVAGLAREFQTLTYRHGLSQWEGEAIVKFRYDQYAPITFKKGVVAGATAIATWLESAEEKPMSVSLCDETGSPSITWRIQKALPVKLEMPSFEAASNDPAIETLTVMACGISLEYL